MLPAAAHVRSAAFGAGFGLSMALSAAAVQAGGQAATARAAMTLFAEHCFSPYLTADKARRAFALSGAAHDFYDLEPFSNVAPSPAMATSVTPGTDRRCAVSFAGNYADEAARAAQNALTAEGITTPAPLPARYAATDTTTLLAARQLNPRRVAVVHVGIRDTETFMLVERMIPSASANDN